MQKYGVDETDQGSEKQGEVADATTCPACGAQLETDVNVKKCPTCGTRPFEQGLDAVQ